MANPGDILTHKLMQDGTFKEVVLTPSSIEAATEAETEALRSDLSQLSATFNSHSHANYASKNLSIALALAL